MVLLFVVGRLTAGFDLVAHVDNVFKCAAVKLHFVPIIIGSHILLAGMYTFKFFQIAIPLWSVVCKKTSKYLIFRAHFT